MMNVTLVDFDVEEVSIFLLNSSSLLPVIRQGKDEQWQEDFAHGGSRGDAACAHYQSLSSQISFRRCNL